MDKLNSKPGAGATAEHEGEREKIKGVFSCQEVRKVGTGTTTRKTIQKSFWFAEEMDDGQITVQPLNANYVPSGPKRTVTLEEFLGSFSPEMEFYVQTVFPRMREMNKTIARADRHRQRGEHYSAEYEYGNALKVDEDNVRANFGLGLTYLERGQSEKADDVFQRIVKLEAAFEEEHKHLFNEFGINLRKNKMLPQSLEYYQRALELSKADENLYINMARAYFDSSKYAEAVESLLEALKLNPQQEVAHKFLAWMQSKELIPSTLLDKVQNAQNSLAQPAGTPEPAGIQG
ncbi:MAG: tetratricopeptide repeat protein [Desulfovibrionaceae bacterium]|nr:tetratricopeptide repeat protein [Desulfovibrionaceae bacterium]